MNKIKTLFVAVAAMFAANTYAQVDPTFIFLDEKGNEIPSGSTVYCSTPEYVYYDEEDPDAGGYYQVSAGVSVKNTADVDMGADAIISVSKLDNGTLSCCFPENCKNIDKVSTERNEKAVLPAGTSRNIQTEFLPAAEGEAEMTLTVGVYNVTYETNKWGITTPNYDELDLDNSEKPMIHLSFKYSTTGVNDIEAEKTATVVARYTAEGKQIAQPQHGVNILKLSNGKTMKVVVR